jgi:hypothetical protein
VRNVQRRTNNNLEAWHSRFDKRVRVDHQNIFVFVEALRKEMDFVRVKLWDMQLELPVQGIRRSSAGLRQSIIVCFERAQPTDVTRLDAFKTYDYRLP